MDWPEELVKLHEAISTEHGNRIFKSILSDVLDYDSHLTELKDLRIKILAIESSLPPETSIHYLLQISQQLNTLSADVTQKFDALARIEHQLESGMATFAQKIVAIEQKVAVLEQAQTGHNPTLNPNFPTDSATASDTTETKDASDVPDNPLDTPPRSPPGIPQSPMVKWEYPITYHAWDTLKKK